MSVSKYIEEFNASIQKSIQKNLDKAEQNPYPSEEIKQIRESDPESALAKMFDENGQLIDNQGLMFAAIDQDKDLYDRLRKGHRAKDRLKNNERLENLDAEEYLNNNYFKFKQGLADVSSLGSNIDANELLKPENLEDFEEIVEIGLDIDTSYVNNETMQSAFLEKMNSSQVEAVEEAEEAEEAISPINPIESEEIQEEEEATAELAEPIAEEESIATDIVTPTVSALTLPEEQELSSPVNPINQPAESAEESEEVIEPSNPGSILNNQSETNVENTNVTNEEVSNNFISNLGDVTNLNTATESISNAINSVSNPLDILNNTSSGDVLSTINDVSSGDVLSTINDVSSGDVLSTINDISSGDVISSINDISSFSELSNLNQGDTLNQVGDLLNTEESFSSFSTVLNPSSIKSNVENIKNNISNQESFEKFSNFSSFPTTEIVKPEPVTKEDISKVGESISTGIGSKLSIPYTSEETVTGEETSRRETRKEERRERREERKEEKQETGTYVEGTDVSSLERRLKNIELLLQGPLEVKIKH